MKIRNLLFLFLGIAMMLGLHSCMSDFSEDDYKQTVSRGEKISIKVSMPQCEEDGKGSRVIYNDNDLSLKWEEGDQLALVGYDSKGNPKGKSVLSLNIIDDQRAGVFSGTTVNGATEYDVYYPADAVDDKGNIIINYNNQVQVGDNNTAHLKKFILLKQIDKRRLTTNEILLQERDIPLQMQNSIMKFELSNIKIKTINILNIYLNDLVSMKWEVKNPQGKVLSSISLRIQDVNVRKTQKFTGYLCFSDKDIEIAREGITTVYLRENTKGSGLNPIFDNCFFYDLEISKNIIYNSNHRYIAKIDRDWSILGIQKGRYRVYYTSNEPLSASMFSPAPESGSYDSNTQVGYYDFVQEWGSRDPERYKKIALKNVGNVNLTDLDIQGIVRIEKEAFAGCKNLTSITLPESITSIGENAFANCTNLKIINVNAIAPPKLEKSLGVDMGNLEIHVPLGSVNKYKKASGWSKYKGHIFSRK